MRARELLLAHFPEALGGVLAGSVARGEETQSSDVDLVVLLAGRPAPMRRTERVQGWVVEYFVHTEASFEESFDQERQRGRAPLMDMCAHGVIVLDHAEQMARVQDLARARWADGPPALTAQQIEDRRYRLTALLDDLADEPDPADRAVAAAAVFTDAADFALAARGCWSGTGRWLAHRLRVMDERLGQDLVAGLRLAGSEDASVLLTHARAVLDQHGGRLEVGYQRRARNDQP